jgi:ParB family transcriptional regulator, chromosome partitioning protein
MQQAIIAREINEGHARPLLALTSRPEEQETLFKEIILKKLPVRAAERIARSIAQENVRKYHRKTPDIVALEKSLTETLGTRVIIETNAEGGRLLIDFFSPDDLQHLAATLTVPAETKPQEGGVPLHPNTTQLPPDDVIAPPAPDAPNDDELYSVRNFSV